MPTDDLLYPCPACGFLQFEGPPGTYEICDVCGWEDDHVQLARPSLRGGANRISLVEAQQKAVQAQPMDVQRLGELRRDPTWRPLTDREASVDATDIQSGADYFAAASLAPTLYYWKR